MFRLVSVQAFLGSRFPVAKGRHDMDIVSALLGSALASLYAVDEAQQKLRQQSRVD
jgi:hypothetical protein